MADEPPIEDEAWERLVKNMLRAEMMRRGVSYEALAQRLATLGIVDTVANMRNKVARGRFTATFFAQCMVALGVKELQVPSAASVREVMTEHGAQALAKKAKSTAGPGSRA